MAVQAITQKDNSLKYGSGYFFVKTLPLPSPFSSKLWPPGCKAERKTLLYFDRHCRRSCARDIKYTSSVKYEVIRGYNRGYIRGY